MSRNWKVICPAFTAVIVLVIACFFEIWLGSIYDLDIPFNILLIVIAVLGGLWAALPAKVQSGWRLTALLSNLLVPILAFPMNIAVFGHGVNWNNPLENLWGGHIGWLLGFALQILFLSDLGKQLINWVRRLLALEAQVAKAVKRGIPQIAKNRDKGIFAIMTVSTAVWAVFLIGNVFHFRTGEILASADTLWGSLCIWVTCVFIGAIAYTTPLTIQKVNGAMKGLEPRKVLIVVAAVIVIAILSIVFPFLLETANDLMILLSCLVCLIIGGRSGEHAGIGSQERRAQSRNTP